MLSVSAPSLQTMNSPAAKRLRASALDAAVSTLEVPGLGEPKGLLVQADRSILVADAGNNAVRRLTMEGVVSTEAGNGEGGYADGEGAAARFNYPMDVVVNKEGTMIGRTTTMGACGRCGAAGDDAGGRLRGGHGRRRGGRRALRSAIQ
jgi:hypothetical protein